MARLARSAERRTLYLGPTVSVSYAEVVSRNDSIASPHFEKAPGIDSRSPPARGFLGFLCFRGGGGGGRLRRRPAKPMQSPRVHSSTAKASIQ